MIDLINVARNNKSIDEIIEQVPYAKLIGMQALYIGDELLFKLPALDSNIGNNTLPAIHGGCIGGFMELAAGFHVLSLIECERIPKVVDFSLDYLRPGRFQETYCRCHVVRQGRKVVNVSISAWQTQEQLPIANARVHLLL
ncbi:MAG: PaaI family thioesterase [Sinobacterium sp.]|nr:PaaI family thioesterase [Sinobacterium sp.]